MDGRMLETIAQLIYAFIAIINKLTNLSTFSLIGKPWY